MGASKEFQRNMGDFIAILRGYSFVLKKINAAADLVRETLVKPTTPG
jgi:hypothetical protein